MFNLPNALTALRVALTPLVVWTILSGQSQAAIALFIVAAITDVFDGAAARHFKLESQIGAYFDPIADKCLMVGTFLALAIAHAAPWWFFALVLGRDLCILSSAAIFFAFTPVRKLPPSVWGKASTFAQTILAGAWMMQDLFRSLPLAPVAMSLLWISTVLTAWSGIHYTWQGIRLYRNAV